VRFVLLTVIDSPDPEPVELMLASLFAQDYERWSLVAACDKHSRRAFARASKVLPRSFRKSHLLVAPRPGGTPRPRALASAARLIVADPGAPDRLIGVIGEHDALAPWALSMTDKAAAGARQSGRGSLPLVVYTDEDEIGAGGLLRGPKLKPDWSADLLLAWNYTGRLFFVREDHFVSAVLPCLDSAPSSEEDFEHAMALAACFDEEALCDPDAVLHVPEVLYHRKPTQSPDPPKEAWSAASVARAADALARHGGHASVEAAAVGEGARAGVDADGSVVGPIERTCGHPRWVVRWQPPRALLVSAIIPFRDGARLLRNCLESIRATTAGAELELLLVDNDSVEPETAALCDRLAAWPQVRILEHPGSFNWAAINNEAAKHARGSVLAFLNDDLEALEDGWLETLVGHAVRPDVGATGPRLVYPGGELQHAGLVLGMGGAAGHLLRGLPAGAPGYMGLAATTRECSAVTGACMLTRRSVFEEMGGFDPLFASDLNDIDYCLRLTEQGYKVIFVAEATLVHHESPSRGTTGSIPDIAAFLARFEARIKAGDPFLSPHLSRMRPDCSLASDEEDAWWANWRDWVLAVAASERGPAS
jgi:GT2 family glycosyltransferase